MRTFLTVWRREARRKERRMPRGEMEEKEWHKWVKGMFAKNAARKLL
jgi:hypothetical protein